MKDKWIVEAKIDGGFNDGKFHEDTIIEISALRESNEHGKESYGWGNCDSKIILFKESYDPGELPDKKTLDQLTQKLCEILNEEGF